jgi:trans-aconitate methyltransferase
MRYYGKNTPDFWTDRFVSGRWHGHGQYKTYMNMLETLHTLNTLNIPVRGKKVLDIGCAIGNGTQMLHDAGAEAVGADFVEAALDCARSYFPDVRFEQWDIRNVPEDFDIIITSHTIEHMGSEAESTLRHLADRCHYLAMNCEVYDFNPESDEIHTGLVATAVRNFPPTYHVHLPQLERPPSSVCVWT